MTVGPENEIVYGSAKLESDTAAGWENCCRQLAAGEVIRPRMNAEGQPIVTPWRGSNTKPKPGKRVLRGWVKIAAVCLLAGLASLALVIA